MARRLGARRGLNRPSFAAGARARAGNLSLMSRSRASTEAGRRRASKATGRTRSTEAQGGRPGELRGPGAEADGDQEQPVTLDHSERGFPPHREAAALQASRDQITPQAAPLAAPSPHRPQEPVLSPSSPAARAPGDRAGLVEVPPRGGRDRGRNRRRRLHVLAARLLAGRGRQRRRGGRHERRPRADRGRADQGRRGHDDPARRCRAARRGGAGLPDRRRDQRRSQLPARHADRGHRAPAGDARERGRRAGPGGGRRHPAARGGGERRRPPAGARARQAAARAAASTATRSIRRWSWAPPRSPCGR